MSDTKTVVVGGFPVLSILGLIFVTLKLTGVIAWSWWWVLSPWLIPLGLVIGILGIALVAALFSK